MDTTHDDLRFWLALNRTPGIGTITFSRLLQHVGDPPAIFAQSAAALTALGLSSATRAALRRPDWLAVERDLEWAAMPDQYALTLRNGDYPSRLREMADPPPVLFVKGQRHAIAQQPQLAMVGSRSPTPGGRALARELAEQLAACGVTITSGLALGIDAAGHEGALRGGGETVAVAGTGLDRVYPARHRDLAVRVAARGALVSEFPPGTPPARDHFPRRNRIISGLCQAVLVVEAAARSGSLITARLALEQGRDVLAVPGAPYNPKSRGCNELLRQGAALVETAADVQAEMGWDTARAVQLTGTGGVESPMALDADQQAVLGCTGFEPTPLDRVVEQSGLTPEAVSSILLVLELQGLVESAPGGCVCRTA